MDWIAGLDSSALTFVNSTMSHPWLDAFFPFITDLHKTWIFNVVVYPGLLALLWRKHGRLGALVFATVLVCLATTDGFTSQVIKKNIERARPFETPGVLVTQRSPASGFGFPSNHAANMFALAAVLTPFLPAASPWLFAVAALIGYSRVYNGVHFPGDVFAGALLGSIFGLAYSWILLRWKPRLRERKQ